MNKVRNCYSPVKQGRGGSLLVDCAVIIAAVIVFVGFIIIFGG